VPVRHVTDLRPNPYNGKLFDKSLQENDPGLIYLTEEINRDGLRHPIFCRPDGMIIDGERRWRAVTMLGWKVVDTIEKDVPDDEVLDYIVRAVSSARQSSLREQARIYLAYKMHLKATTRLPREERKIQAMQRAHFPFSDTQTAEQVVAVFKRADPIIQERLNHDQISVAYAYASMYRQDLPIYARPKVRGPYKKHKERPPNKRERERAQKKLERDALQKELDAKFAAAPKDPEPDDVDVTTGLPAAFNDYRLDPLIEKAFERIQEPVLPPEPPKPMDLDHTFEDALQKIWVRDKPETTLLRLIQCFVNGVESVHGQDANRAQGILRQSFEVLRPLLKLKKDGGAP
jgi:hypothetical protein